MKQYIEVGKVNNTHGIKGEVKLQLWCDSIDYLKQFKTLYLDDNGKNPLTVQSIKSQKDNAIIQFKDINTIELAEKLKNKVIFGNRDDASIDENSHYVADVIGCFMVDIDTNEEYGKIVDVSNYGSCDIYDIESWGKHTLVPAIDDVIKEVNLEYKVVYVKSMKGLFDED